MAIQECDMLFAYISTKDCYGTLVEIGYAKALNKPIYIAFDHDLFYDLREFWFAAQCASAFWVLNGPDQLIPAFIRFVKAETSMMPYRRRAKQ
jgi:nucleoside 2-deoxyribosyltransferase